MIVRNWQ